MCVCLRLLVVIFCFLHIGVRQGWVDWCRVVTKQQVYMNQELSIAKVLILMMGCCLIVQSVHPYLFSLVFEYSNKLYTLVISPTEVFSSSFFVCN